MRKIPKVLTQRRRVAIIGSPETLLGAERGLRRSGIRVDRIPVFRYVPTPRAPLRRSLAKFGPYDVLLLTSKESVRVMAGLGVLRARGRVRYDPEIFVAGPATARALAAFGRIVTWRAAGGLGRAAAEPLAHRPPLRVVYPRSDRAGPSLARRLRRHGHTVLDLVAYRVAPVVRPTRPMAERLRRARCVLVTSPSALSYLRRSLGPSAFGELRRRAGLVVLGTTSARAARGHGFRGVRIVPEVSGTAVRDFLLAEMAHGD